MLMIRQQKGSVIHGKNVKTIQFKWSHDIGYSPCEILNIHMAWGQHLLMT